MIALDTSSQTPGYLQIYEALRRDIAQGAYRVDERLPSVRDLARDLGVSRNTVNKAYQQLFAEGYVISRDRSGYYVDPNVFDYVDFSSLAEQPPAIEEGTLHPRPSKTVEFDFFYGSLPDGLLPQDQLRRAVGEALYAVDGSNDYSDAFGLFGFREALGRYLSRSRSVRCVPEQIAIQSGTRDGIERLLHLFDPSTDVIAVEQPGYPGIVQVARNRHFSLAPVDATSREQFFDDLESSGAKIVFVTPSHQFPTGRIMPYADRLRILEWAHRTGAYIIEDDYDSEYRFHERPLPSLQSLDRHGRVIYSGTFSKTFSPGMRASYLVLPPHLVGPYRDRLASYWCPASWLIQKTLGILLENGTYERQARKQMKHFRASQKALSKALREQLGEVVEASGEGAGLHLWLHAIDGRTASELAALALEEGVRIYPGNPYWMKNDDVDPTAFLLGYSGLAPEDIEPGIARLARAWNVRPI